MLKTQIEKIANYQPNLEAGSKDDIAKWNKMHEQLSLLPEKVKQLTENIAELSKQITKHELTIPKEHYQLKELYQKVNGYLAAIVYGSGVGRQDVKVYGKLYNDYRVFSFVNIETAKFYHEIEEEIKKTMILYTEIVQCVNDRYCEATDIYPYTGSISMGFAKKTDTYLFWVPIGAEIKSLFQ